MAVSKAKKDATNRYRAKKDAVMIYLPQGTADAIRAQGESVSGLCCRLVAEWLTARGVTLDPNDRAKNSQPETQPERATASRQAPTAAASDKMNTPTGESDAETVGETPTAGAEFPPLDLDLFL